MISTAATPPSPANRATPQPNSSRTAGGGGEEEAAEAEGGVAQRTATAAAAAVAAILPAPGQQSDTAGTDGGGGRGGGSSGRPRSAKATGPAAAAAEASRSAPGGGACRRSERSASARWALWRWCTYKFSGTPRIGERVQARPHCPQVASASRGGKRAQKTPTCPGEQNKMSPLPHWPLAIGYWGLLHENEKCHHPSSVTTPSFAFPKVNSRHMYHHIECLMKKEKRSGGTKVYGERTGRRERKKEKEKEKKKRKRKSKATDGDRRRRGPKNRDGAREGSYSSFRDLTRITQPTPTSIA